MATERAPGRLTPSGSTGSDRAGQVETDQARRLELYTQLQLMAQEVGTFAPFNQPDIQTAFRADLQGYIYHWQWLIDVALLSRAE